MQYEAILRLSVFLGLLALFALLELLSPRRPRVQGRRHRWVTNLTLVALGTAALRLLALALPFLALAFVPALRRRLPKPGAWMNTFRRWMALPMGLTALALIWLASRVGGNPFAIAAAALGPLAVHAKDQAVRSAKVSRGPAGVDPGARGGGRRLARR